MIATCARRLAGRVFRRTVLNFHRMLFNFQRIHPAAELQFCPGLDGALRQRSIELAFINYLCERGFRPVLQFFSSGEIA